MTEGEKKVRWLAENKEEWKDFEYDATFGDLARLALVNKMKQAGLYHIRRHHRPIRFDFIIRKAKLLLTSTKG